MGKNKFFFIFFRDIPNHAQKHTNTCNDVNFSERSIAFWGREVRWFYGYDSTWYTAITTTTPSLLRKQDQYHYFTISFSLLSNSVKFRHTFGLCIFTFLNIPVSQFRAIPIYSMAPRVDMRKLVCKENIINILWKFDPIQSDSAFLLKFSLHPHVTSRSEDFIFLFYLIPLHWFLIIIDFKSRAAIIKAQWKP